MKHKLMLAVLLAALVLSGAAYAADETAPMPKGGPMKMEKTVEVRAGCPGMGGGMGMGQGMGMGMMDAPNLSPAMRKRMMEQRIKSFKETSQLRDNVAVKRMELNLLWLDSMPDQSKVIAKMREVNQAEMALKEKQVANMFAMRALMPPDMRKGMGMGMGMGMMGGCGMMGGNMGDMMPGMGMGMGQNMMQRQIIMRDDNSMPGMMGGMEGCPGCPNGMGLGE